MGTSGVSMEVVGSSVSLGSRVDESSREDVCRRALIACDEALALYQPQSQSQHSDKADVGWLQSFITTID